MTLFCPEFVVGVEGSEEEREGGRDLVRGERWRKRGFGSKRMVGRWRGEVERGDGEGKRER